jgi:hypothetical protein
MIQELIVAVIVIGCTAYAVWVLMPSALRRSLAQQLMGWPLPDFLASRMKRAAQAGQGCACSGCDAVGKSPSASRTGPGDKPANVQIIQIHRRSKP